MSFKEIFWYHSFDLDQPSMELRGSIFWVLSRTALSFFFSTAIEVERSEPSVEPGTIIPKGLGLMKTILLLFVVQSIYII